MRTHFKVILLITFLATFSAAMAVCTITGLKRSYVYLYMKKNTQVYPGYFFSVITADNNRYPAQKYDLNKRNKMVKFYQLYDSGTVYSGSDRPLPTCTVKWRTDRRIALMLVPNDGQKRVLNNCSLSCVKRHYVLKYE